MQRSDLNLLSEAYSNVNSKRQLLAESAYYWNSVSIKELFKNASDEVINESWESFKVRICEGLIGDTYRATLNQAPRAASTYTAPPAPSRPAGRRRPAPPAAPPAPPAAPPAPAVPGLRPPR